jgi:uncharacterized membrane protein YecN with MAPEG domain
LFRLQNHNKNRIACQPREITMPVITTLYAGLLGLILLFLAFKAGSMRGKLGISVGHGDSMDLLLAMRKQANFVEYVPMILILLGLLEVNGAPKLAIHIMGAALVIARICHAQGFRHDTMAGKGRFVGAAGTALLLLVTSIWAIVVFV